MSGIFGIHHPDNRPIDPEDLERMAAGSKHRGPDCTKTIIQPYIGFGHCMLQTTLESVSENLPYTDPASGIVITADARIDNRRELFDKLGELENTSIPDSQIILEMYKKGGTDSFSHLLGDFAFTLWDPVRAQLICARDYIGVKPLYYLHNQNQFLFSSEIKQIVEHPGVSLSPNETMIAECLSFSFCSHTETLFKGIKRLAPGHFLVLSKQSCTTHRFWSFDDIQPIYYQKAEDYCDHFLTIFNKAVRCRLRSATPISIELSGGLDSSSVVGMATTILRETHGTDPQVYGMTFPGLPCDERSYIQTVSQKYNLNIHLINSHFFIEPDWHQQVATSYELPDIPNITMRDSLIDRVTSSDSRVLLSGIGGDEWLLGGDFPYLDLIKGNKYYELIEQLRYSYSQNKSSTIKRSLVSVLWPFAPLSLRKWFCSRQKAQFPIWINQDLIYNTELSHRILHTDPRIMADNLGKLPQYSVTSRGNHTFFLETMDRYHARAKLEYRSPFLDRRITEFSFAVPDYVHKRHGVNKLLLRNPSNPLLSSSIRQRKDKAEFSYFFGKAFASKELHNKTKQMKLQKMGWVNQRLFEIKLQEKRKLFEQDPFHWGTENWQIWFTSALEMWARRVFPGK